MELQPHELSPRYRRLANQVVPSRYTRYERFPTMVRLAKLGGLSVARLGDFKGFLSLTTSSANSLASS
jgi:hypothetical protein